MKGSFKEDKLNLSKVSVILSDENVRKRGSASGETARKSMLATRTLEDELSMLEQMENYESLAENRAYVIHPHGRFRMIWDIINSFLMILLTVIIPLDLCFEGDFREESDINIFIQTLARVFFFVDIIVAFNTGVESREGSIIMDKRYIARYYIRSWFLLDVMATFPWATAMPNMKYSLTFQRNMSMLRFLRLGSVAKRLEYSLMISSSVSSITRFVFIVLVASHISSCTFAYLVFGDSDLVQQKINDGVLEDDREITLYSASFYWAIMTMTTVGYGDLSPHTTLGRYFAVVAMCLGAVIFAYGVTNVVQIVKNLSLEESKFRARMDRVNTFTARHKIPFAIKEEVHEYYIHSKHKTDNELRAEESIIINSLTDGLREKVSECMACQLLEVMPFFEGCRSEFIVDISHAMRSICYPPGEEVVHEGDIGNEMFFIISGKVEIIRYNTHIVMGKHKYFGEMCVLNRNIKRTATVRTIVYSEIRTLHRDDLDQTLDQHPLVRETIAQMARNKDRKCATLLIDTFNKFKQSLIEVYSAQANGDGYIIEPTIIDDCGNSRITKNYNSSGENVIQAQANNMRRFSTFNLTVFREQKLKPTRNGALLDSLYQQQKLLCDQQKAFQENLTNLQRQIIQVINNGQQVGVDKISGKGQEGREDKEVPLLPSSSLGENIMERR